MDGGAGVVLVLTEGPGVAGIPNELDGVRVVTRVSGEIFAFDPPPHNHGGGGDPIDPTARFDRPVPIGVSTGHPAITVGTIGARVTDGTNVYALSNNHVYANENNATIGDDVIQPGTSGDGASPADDIGTLAAFEPILFDLDLTDNTPGPSNIMDAAIALSSTGDLGNATPSDG